MSTKELLEARAKRKPDDQGWTEAAGKIHIGKDVLELLSSSMYVDPMTIYREYIQNAADSLDLAVSAGVTRRDTARIDISIDPIERHVRIRDNGCGIKAEQFVARLCNLGSSTKRGSTARGFRGVGRLAGLGYCQELIFRTRAKGDASVSEMRWDCRALKLALRAHGPDKDITTLIKEVVTVRVVGGTNFPSHFFEVELRGLIRHRNDRLLNATEVQKYLAQVAPLPFAASFRFGEKIVAALDPFVEMGNVEIFINGNERPLYRPHRNKIALGGDAEDRFEEVEIHQLQGTDGELAGIAWIAHHSYSGALPNDALIKGIRLRVGNVQVGDNALLEELFPEPRFNAWAVGEVHLFDKRIVPNGRRDHFEQNVHYDQITNQLAPVIRDIARRCRHSSIARKWVREFDLLESRARTDAKSANRRGIVENDRARHAREARKSLEAMKSILGNRNLESPIKEELHDRYARTTREVEHLLKKAPQESDPFKRFRPAARSAYREVVGIIYELMPSASVAEKFVDKLLSRLENKPASPRRISSKKKARRR